MTKDPIRFVDLFKYFKGLPHQLAAIEMLGQQIPPSLLHRENDWFGVWSQGGKQEDPIGEGDNSWEGMKKLAKEAGAKFESLVAAQWALESGWGKHVSGKNNFFGLKGDGTSVVTSEFANGKEYKTTASFIDFDSAKDCVQYLVDRWYKDWKNYEGCNNAGNRYNAARWLQNEDYATDPKYANKLIELMDKYDPLEKTEIEAPSRITPNSPFSKHMTPNIRIGEFALDQEARRFVYQYQIDTAALLAAFLERVRRNFQNNPIIITSGYRPPAINKAIGGASGSEHLYSAPGVGAVDFFVENVDIHAVQSFCDKYWDYSVGYGAPKGFVHLGIREGKPRVRWDY